MNRDGALDQSPFSALSAAESDEDSDYDEVSTEDESTAEQRSLPRL